VSRHVRKGKPSLNLICFHKQFTVVERDVPVQTEEIRIDTEEMIIDEEGSSAITPPPDIIEHGEHRKAEWRSSALDLLNEYGENQSSLEDTQIETELLALFQQLQTRLRGLGDPLTERDYRFVFGLMRRICLRPLPPSKNPPDPEAPSDQLEELLYEVEAEQLQTLLREETSPENSEPSLLLVRTAYETFTMLLESNLDMGIARSLIDESFVLRLLGRFDTEDVRERQLVKTAVHRLYGRFLCHRAVIRRYMRHVIYSCVWDGASDEGWHAGLGEMLELLASIINGFALPLRQEHRQFLMRALLPLHSSRLLPLFHGPLVCCIAQFAAKEPTQLIPVIMNSLLRYWPHASTSKQLLFLAEIDELLDITTPEVFHSFARSLVRHLARYGLQSAHFQVAERALVLFSGNEHLLEMLVPMANRLYPLILPALQQLTSSHWSPTVQLQALALMRRLMELAPGHFSLQTEGLEKNHERPPDQITTAPRERPLPHE